MASFSSIWVGCIVSRGATVTFSGTILTSMDENGAVKDAPGVA